jgi:hypothetical protein
LVIEASPALKAGATPEWVHSRRNLRNPQSPAQQRKAALHFFALHNSLGDKRMSSKNAYLGFAALGASLSRCGSLSCIGEGEKIQKREEIAYAG